MRQKNTDIVEGQDFHHQFQTTPDEYRKIKREISGYPHRDEKQGQSKFRIEKKTKKK